MVLVWVRVFQSFACEQSRLEHIDVNAHRLLVGHQLVEKGRALGLVVVAADAFVQRLEEALRLVHAQLGAARGSYRLELLLDPQAQLLAVDVACRSWPNFVFVLSSNQFET